MKILVVLFAVLVPQGRCWDEFERFKRADGGAKEGNSKPINPLWKATWTDKLKQDLLVNYDKFARPMQHGNKTSVVLEPTLRYLELDEKRSVMTIHCWVKMVWEDEKLKWDPNNYNNLKELHLADHEVWQPDVFPFNSASGSTVDHFGNTNLIAYGNGTVLWVPPSIFRVFCQMDLTKWPFDTQECKLVLGSWTYNMEQIDLFNDYHGQTINEVENLEPNAEWHFVKMTVQRNQVTYPCCAVPYVDLTFHITLKRNSSTYHALLITPAIVIVLMTLTIFWLPPTSGDKLTLGGAAALVTCLFVLYFTQKLPVIAGNTPYIVSFYSKGLHLIAFAIVMSVIVINLANNPKTTPLPWILKRNLNGWLGKCLLIKTQPQSPSKAEEMIDSQPVLSDQSRRMSDTEDLKVHQRDWIMLATAIDRICFLIYCFAFAVLAWYYSV